MISYINDQLTIEEIELGKLVQDRPTPFYLYSWNQIEQNIQQVERVFEGVNYHLSFAAKANNNLHLLARLKQRGVGIDVVSKGEFEACKRVGFSHQEVIVNGNGKTKAFLKELVSFQPRSINVDSTEELTRLEEVVFELKQPVVVALRVNPDVDPVTHPYISTGLKKNKFGMELATAANMIRQYSGHPFIAIRGLHLHIGSQLLQMDPYEDAYTKVDQFIQSLEHHGLEFINIGGGWGIDYSREGKGFPLEAYRQRVVPILKKWNMEIILELGRFLVGNSGVLIGTVEYVKRTPYKTFIVTDASMADLIRPSLYEGYHHIYPQYDRGEAGTFDVVGPLCETGDRFAEDRVLKMPESGDLVVVCDVGAYGYAMSSNYNFSLRPAEYLLVDGEIKEIRPREEFDSVIAYYIG